MTPSKLRKRTNNHEQCESRTFSMIPGHERVQHTTKVRVVRVEIKPSRTREVTGILPSSLLLQTKSRGILMIHPNSEKANTISMR